MKATPVYRNCLICDKEIRSTPSRTKRGQDKYCSRKCYMETRKGRVDWLKKYRFEKGHKSWLKGKKGICCNTGRTHFKKGQSPIFPFPKGHKPWNTGLHNDPRILKSVRKAWETLRDRGFPNRVGKKHSIESLKKISLNRRGKVVGEKNNRWKGGITPLRDIVRHLPEYVEWRKKVFERDNYTCVICGKRGYLEADHYPRMYAIILQEAMNKFGKDINLIRKYDPLWNLENGRTTCKEHNPKIYIGNKYEGGIYK